MVSSKGGVGKTTVATNLAVALAQAVPYSTVIVDLDLQFGDVATTLNLSPEHFMAEALQSVASGDTIALKTRLTLHETGLYVLPAPAHPAEADGITSAQISQLLKVLTQEFPYVVVDTSPGLSDHTLGALDHTTDPLLLTGLSVTGVSGMRKVVDTLSVLQMFTDRYHVVVNWADATDGVSLADVEQTLGTPVGTAIPRSKSAPGSANVGVPLMQSHVRDPLVKSLASLVNTLLPEGVKLDPRGRLRVKKRGKA
ncbi:AAA family ATPase [Nesterenkonia sp. CF4.4]|uniref:AAA family ATPase n=1 Tax=Nesterenkonia sp. CF4.4 TaxID=3373079 RepID=UPI003EE424CD